MLSNGFLGNLMLKGTRRECIPEEPSGREGVDPCVSWDFSVGNLYL